MKKGNHSLHFPPTTGVLYESMDVKEANSYIVELIRKYHRDSRVKNKRFSLRALAARFDVSPSTLSEVLRGMRRLNKSTATAIVKRIAPRDPQAIKCLEVLGDHYTPYKVKEIKTLHIQKDQSLFFEQWFHLAILVFLDSKKYDGTIESIADYFGISIAQVTVAVERLLRLDIITKKDQRYLTKAQFYITERSKISDGIHKGKKAALKNAIHALDNKNMEEFSNFSMMFSVFDKQLVPEAIEYLNKMKSGFVKKFNGKGQGTDVYQLSIQLFPCEKLGKNMPRKK